MTTVPTPLDDFEEITTGMMSLAAEDRLRAFLQSPAVLALADPKLRAAAEVVIQSLPELLIIAGKHMDGEDIYDTFDLGADVASILHDAAQAAKDRQVYDQSYKGEAKHE